MKSDHKKQKVYIAGKITGDPNYRKKFRDAQEFLERGGSIVLNPAILPDGMKSGDYMRICIAMLESADKVFMLKDWYGSRGAQIERNYAIYTGKKIVYQK